MSKETTKRIRKPDGWRIVRQHLETLDQSAVIALVKDLYEAAADNRDFIQARCHVGESGGAILEKYRLKMRNSSIPSEAKPNSSLARRVRLLGTTAKPPATSPARLNC